MLGFYQEDRGRATLPFSSAAAAKVGTPSFARPAFASNFTCTITASGVGEKDLVPNDLM